jgi:hypothetical protein
MGPANVSGETLALDPSQCLCVCSKVIRKAHGDALRHGGMRPPHHKWPSKPDDAPASVGGRTCGARNWAECLH